MKIVLIGGHLAPALSVLEAFPKDTEVLFVGRKYGLEGENSLSLEYRTMEHLRIPFVGLNTGRLQRKLTKFTILSLLKIPFAVVKSFLILIKFRPDVVVGFGGYVSVPVIFCAYILGIPVVIHEQTMEVGLANKIVTRFAKKICISWNSSRKYFPKEKVVLTGNPMRKFSIFDSQFSIFKNKFPIIYVTGGSSGSHFINTLIEGIIERLLKAYNVIHQAGDAHKYNDFDRLEKLRKNLPEQLRENYILEKFIDPSEIGDVLKKTSLVISRSGVNTVTELMYFEKPALLIPLPFSQNGEQMRNAKFLEKIGLGKIMNQADLNSKKLLRAITLMFYNINKYKIDRDEIKKMPGGNPAQNVVNVIKYAHQPKTKKIS